MNDVYIRYRIYDARTTVGRLLYTFYRLSPNIQNHLSSLDKMSDFMENLMAKNMLPIQRTTMKTILIDDMRNIEADVVCKDFFSGIEALMNEGPFNKLYLDHDLATFKDGREYTGYDVVCWLEQNPTYCPRHIECVSSNPVGRDRIEQVVQKIYEHRGNNEHKH